MGSSAGGHLAAFLGLVDTRDNTPRSLAQHSSRVQCVVDCYGPVDLVAMMDSASAPIVETLIGTPLSRAAERYRAGSPLWQVSDSPPPFLILHGTADTGEQRGQVPIGISRRFARRLRQAGGQVQLVPLKGAPHGFTATPWSLFAHATRVETLKFVERFL